MTEHNPDWKLLGITNNEFKIYETLLKQGASTISFLADKAHLNERSAYDYIERLINKGLVGQIIHNGKRMFLGLNPEMLSNIIDEEKKDIEDEFAELEAINSEGRKQVMINIINTKAEFLKIIKGIENANEIYFGKGFGRIKKEPNMEYFLSTNKKNNIKKKEIKFSNAEIICIFTENIFLIYSIEDKKGFFIDNDEFTGNMKVYFK